MDTFKTKKLRFALPKGSLNEKGRGNTEEMLKEAGYDIRGYNSSSRTYKPVIANAPDIECIVDRPQNMPADLRDGVIDLGILGDDIAEEWRLAGIQLTKLSNLMYGYAELVLAARKKTSEGQFLEKLRKGEQMIFATEYPFVTQGWLMERPGYAQVYGAKKPKIMSKYGTFGENDRIRIKESNGATESAILKGSADFIVECSSSGDTLYKNGLEKLCSVLESYAGLYTTETAMSDGWKADKILSIKSLLEGVVKARKTDYIILNVPSGNEKELVDYLTREKLFTKEPTLNRGDRYTTISIEIEKSRWPNVADEMKKKGAQDIIRLKPDQIID